MTSHFSEHGPSEQGALAFACFFAPLIDVESALTEVISSHDLQDRLTFSEAEFEPQLLQLYKVRKERPGTYQAILYEPQNRPTVCVLVSPLADGWLTLVNSICTVGKFSAIQINSTDVDAEWPKHSFRWIQDGIEVRVVQALKDSTRWEFVERGEALKFERVESYAQRTKRLRFNRAILLDYLQSVSLDVGSKDFWKTEKNVLLVEYRY